jgi:hypothetical protein
MPSTQKSDYNKKNLDRIEAFQKWIHSMPRKQLNDLLIDGFVKGQIQDSEIKRFFELSRYGVDMRHRPLKAEA